jgi:hypothetical protein
MTETDAKIHIIRNFGLEPDGTTASILGQRTDSNGLVYASVYICLTTRDSEEFGGVSRPIIKFFSSTKTL